MSEKKGLMTIPGPCFVASKKDCSEIHLRPTILNRNMASENHLQVLPASFEFSILSRSRVTAVEATKTTFKPVTLVFMFILYNYPTDMNLNAIFNPGKNSPHT